MDFCVGTPPQHGQNAVEHGVGVGQDLVIPEAQYEEAPIMEIVVTAGIAVRFGVLATIGFHDYAGLQANEVHDEGADGVLPTELPAECAAVTQVAPEFLFGVGHCTAQCLGSLLFGALTH